MGENRYCNDDLYRMKNDEDSQNWTNEKHSDFLSLMEASFVQSMFARKTLRPVPDIAESTLDSKPRKIGATPSGVRVLDVMTTLTRTQRQRRSTTTHPYKISHDQVVPEMYDETKDKGKK